MEPFQIKKLPHPIAAKAKAGDTIDQMMWPDHCIQASRGADFHTTIAESLAARRARGGQVVVVQKVRRHGGATTATHVPSLIALLTAMQGEKPDVDGYSAFS